jgi:transcriptional regulator with XRE-family HTH domain
MDVLPSIDMAATGDNIIRLRRRNGLTVQDLQNVFGFSTPQAIYKWQRGVAMPTLDNLVVLASVFGTTMDAIVIRTGAASS